MKALKLLEVHLLTTGHTLELLGGDPALAEKREKVLSAYNLYREAYSPSVDGAEAIFTEATELLGTD